MTTQDTKVQRNQAGTLRILEPLGLRIQARVLKEEISLYEIAGAAQKIKESFHTIHEIPPFVKY